jgi:hypothetical protein
MHIVQFIGYILCIIVIIVLIKNNDNDKHSDTSNDFSVEDILQINLDDIDMV